MSKPFSLAIHAGAGVIFPEQMTAARQQSISADLTAAVTAGHQILQAGGCAVDAVVAAVKVLEDSPNFNAGKGSVLTHDEMVEMDASLMDGGTQAAGAVAGVRHIKNPIELARDVMQKSQHVLLIGEGAEQFAFEHGHQYTEQDYFFTDHRYEQLLSMRKKGLCGLAEARNADEHQHGTVGAVALDQSGNLAAATSTGGLTNKQYGRVGDSALIGCGTVAENGVVAVSTTGIGEIFIRKRVAEDVAARMRYLQEDVHTACDTIIHGELNTMGGEGGLIAIDARGDVHFALNCTGMYRASIDTHGQLTVKIYADD
ncbi:isoaspartyl peptidase/L-asparaginase [Vibrio sp. CAU 1672]|uniref:isoaspartyl peptidase/L-asparaginase family protein n=1 Tax=Vibrio sp. CAU 1672 TaxID=3032594 RepID=UPI0023DCD8EF|nr:isoaspartyl peptidase/L-asparaginase [Vibrio sp. CAU 1672]MDF2154688.1 isoaspartyl peptidase/L-asparaginase [Vibrio sp. CAU 1672]